MSELHVRKRTVEKSTLEMTSTNCCNRDIKTHPDIFISPCLSEATMFYPPCPQYYPVTNEWNPVIQYPLYDIQPMPVIVNPLLSPHTYPLVGPLTIANQYPVLPLVSTNEFTHMNVPHIVSSASELAPAYCEMSPIISDISSLDVCNEVSLAITPALSPYTYIPCEFSTIEAPISDIFTPIQNIQVPNECIPNCNTVWNENSPLSSCSYDSLSYEYFQSDLPIIDENTLETELYLHEHEHSIENPLEFYLSLPNDLFPTPWMMTIDPNAIIDEFCKVPNLDDHSWILDLEFGVPKTPVTRRVATYNVKLNSIHCKNVPEAIHPGFESCDKGLKRALKFYYDCVISNWYRGYIALTSDKSVENFQTWLSLPMQILGMCWP